MARPKNWRVRSAAHARASKAAKKASGYSPSLVITPDNSEEVEILEEEPIDLTGVPSESEETKWAGGVNHDLETDNSDFSWDEENESTSDDDPDMTDDELVMPLQNVEHGVHSLTGRTKAEWKKAEENRVFGYTGNSARTARRKSKQARDKEVENANMRKTWVSFSYYWMDVTHNKNMTRHGAQMMRNFLAAPLTASVETRRDTASVVPNPDFELRQQVAENPLTAEIFAGYLSDDEQLPEDEPDFSVQGEVTANGDLPLPVAIPSFSFREPPPLKRRRLDIPYRVVRQQIQDDRRKHLERGLSDIDKIFESTKVNFEVGREGLQARRARAIRSYLYMVVKNGREGIEASERAAEAQGFSAKWGGRQVRSWVQQWLRTRTLPTSTRGRHIKSYSLLEDPVIRAELRSFVRSNKWSMDPGKLANFSQHKMIPATAEKYLRHVVDEEMPKGLKRYIELELFPRIQQKVTKGVSLETARRFLRKEGFRYTEHKKTLFYDGHDRPDVVDYRQNVFIPQLTSLRHRIVEYDPSNFEIEVKKTPANYVERRAILVPQDEMTAQAHDGMKKSWVLDGEQPLRKKGAGRGIHQSDVISSMAGWMKEASQSLEYGKNYDGYWNGELFIKQVRPSRLVLFSRAHLTDRCGKKSYPPLNVNMGLDSRLSFLSTTRKAMVLMQKMLF